MLTSEQIAKYSLELEKCKSINEKILLFLQIAKDAENNYKENIKFLT